MKTFQILLLAVFGLAAVAGLFVFATSKGIGGGGNQVGTVVIWGSLPQEGMDAAIEALTYDPRYDGVSYLEVPEASMSATLAQAIAEGRGPDLVVITQEQLLSERSKLTPVPPQSLPVRDFVDAYVPMAELFLSSEGAYGIPFVVDPLVLYYDRAALASAGAAGAPTTWEGVLALAPTLSRVTDDRQAVIESAVPLGDYANVANARALLSLILLQSGTSISAATEAGQESTLRGDGETVPAEAAVSFYAQFANPAKTVYSWNRSLPESTDAFVAGTLAMYPGFASERPFLAAANPNLEFDMARMPQPAVNGTRMTYGRLYAFAVPRASMNPTGALEAAFGLASSAVSPEAAKALSMAPAMRIALTPDPSDRYAAVYYPEAMVARGWLSPAPATTDGIFSGMITNVTSGRMSALQAVRAAHESLEAALP